MTLIRRRHIDVHAVVESHLDESGVNQQIFAAHSVGAHVTGVFELVGAVFGQFHIHLDVARDNPVSARRTVRLIVMLHVGHLVGAVTLTVIAQVDRHLVAGIAVANEIDAVIEAFERRLGRGQGRRTVDIHPFVAFRLPVDVSQAIPGGARGEHHDYRDEHRHPHQRVQAAGTASFGTKHDQQNAECDADASDPTGRRCDHTDHSGFAMIMAHDPEHHQRRRQQHQAERGEHHKRSCGLASSAYRARLRGLDRTRRLSHIPRVRLRLHRRDRSLPLHRHRRIARHGRPRHRRWRRNRPYVTGTIRRCVEHHQDQRERNKRDPPGDIPTPAVTHQPRHDRADDDKHGDWGEHPLPAVTAVQDILGDDMAVVGDIRHQQPRENVGVHAETAEEGEDDDDGTHQGGAPAQPVGDTGAHTADIPVFGADQAALPDPPEEHVTPVAFRCFVRFGLAGRIPIAVAGAGLACRRGIDVLALGVVVTALLAAVTVRLTGLRLPRGLS